MADRRGHVLRICQTLREKAKVLQRAIWRASVDVVMLDLWKKCSTIFPVEARRTRVMQLSSDLLFRRAPNFLKEPERKHLESTLARVETRGIQCESKLREFIAIGEALTKLHQHIEPVLSYFVCFPLEPTQNPAELPTLLNSIPLKEVEDRQDSILEATSDKDIEALKSGMKAHNHVLTGCRARVAQFCSRLKPPKFVAAAPNSASHSNVLLGRKIREFMSSG